MAGLDLTGVRSVLDDLIFEGTGVKVTDDNGVVDDELDEDGELVPAGESDVYTGVGVIVPVTSFGAGTVADIGVAIAPTDSETTHKLLLPLAAPAGIRVGAQVEATAINPLTGDPQLVGRHFEVTEIPTNAALSVLRIAFLKPVRTPDAPDPDPEP